MQDMQMQELIDSVMLAGKIMIESGADMARVDDTLKRIARNGGIKEPKIFETTTGIMMSVPNYKLAQVEPIQKRTIDLEKVSRVNDHCTLSSECNLSLLQPILAMSKQKMVLFYR